MTPSSQSCSVHLRDALGALVRSDKAQGFRAADSPSSRANIGETRELRAALRALIQHVEEQDRTIARLVAESHRFDPMRPIG